MNGGTITDNGGNGLEMDGGSMTVTGTNLVSNQSMGMYLNNGTATFTNVTVQGSSSTGVYMNTGSYTFNAPTVKNNEGDGLYELNNNWGDMSVTVVTGTITGNAGAGIRRDTNWGDGDGATLNVQGTSVMTNGRGIDLQWADDDYMTLIGDTVSGNNGYGISTQNPEGYNWGQEQETFQQNVVEDNEGTGIFASGSWNGGMQVVSNTVEGNTGMGVYVNAQNEAATVNGNDVESNTGGGMNVTASGSGNPNVTVSWNTVRENSGGGQGGAFTVNIQNWQQCCPTYYGSTGTAEDNLIVSNTVASGSNAAVQLNADSLGTLTFEYNTVVNNVAAGSQLADGPTTLDVWGTVALEHNNIINLANTYEIATGNASGTTDLDATNSWWNTTDPNVIGPRLYDFAYNLNRGVIDYSPVLSGAEPNAPPVPPISSGGGGGGSPTPTPTPPCTNCHIIPGGSINLNQEWVNDGEPYYVNGNLLVASGVTLTIDAGVTVEFARNRGMQFNGTIYARGTVNSPILFTSGQASKAAGDWAALILANGSPNATYDGNGHYVSGPIIENAVIQYAGGNGATAALKVGNAGPYLHNLTIENNATEGI